jgi:hypothetical protein
MSRDRCSENDLGGSVLPCQHRALEFGGKCGLHTDLDNRDAVAAEILWVLNFVRHGGVGDGGEMPFVDVHFDGSRWRVEVGSFYNGHAHVTSDRTLQDALIEVRERLTMHPERERRDEVERAAMEVAGLTTMSKAEALAWLEEHAR